ncbi:MAG: adenylate kinase [Acidobacteria bacterium]|nr:adenylate kinase [Acidobacteriota bacterium]
MDNLAAQLNLVLLGPPGAGKGTQAIRLAAAWGIPHISTGNMLREAVRAGTELGRRAQAVIDGGRLVNDEIMIGIVQERIARPDAARGFVLDGFPRTLPQAEALDGLLDGRDPLVVIDLAVPDPELIRRLSKRRLCTSCGLIVGAAEGDPPVVCEECGGVLHQRNDDREPVVRERLQVYRRSTQPLLDYYGGRTTFRAVDGTQPPDSVAAATADAVEALSPVRRSA